MLFCTQYTTTVYCNQFCTDLILQSSARLKHRLSGVGDQIDTLSSQKHAGGSGSGSEVMAFIVLCM